MSKKRKSGLRRLGKKLMAPDFMRTAEALNSPGEAGRAIPGSGRSKPVASEGVASIPASKGRTEISTYSTRSGGQFKIYESDSWMRMRITLLTAGPVDIGTRENISPVLSGKGGSLITGETMEFEIAPSERIFITASAVNRVRIIASPIPFGVQVLESLGFIRNLLRKVR